MSLRRSEEMRRLAVILQRRITEYDSRHPRRYRKASPVPKILNDGSAQWDPGLFTGQRIATTSRDHPPETSSSSPPQAKRI